MTSLSNCHFCTFYKSLMESSLLMRFFSFILFLFKYLRHPELEEGTGMLNQGKIWEERNKAKNQLYSSVFQGTQLLSLVSSRWSLPFSAALPSCFMSRSEKLTFRWDIADDRDVPWSRPSSYCCDLLCFGFQISCRWETQVLSLLGW